MGRKSLNRTYEEMLDHKRIKANEYYKLHREEINKKRTEKYNKLKNDSLNKNNS